MKPEIKERIEQIKRGEVPKGYKKTSIGCIPINWDVKRLDEISNITGGKRLPKGSALQDENNGHPYITVSDMFNGGINISSIRYVPDNIVEKIKQYTITTDDIFISVAGSLGIAGIIPPELNGANLTENANKISNIKINQKYLLYLLQSNIIQKEINSVKTLSAQPKLALGRLRKFKIPISSEIEQKNIAIIISTWDKAIELKQQLIDQKKEQKRGLMQLLLSGKKRLNGFSGEWKKVKLRQFLESKDDKSTINNQHSILSCTKDGLLLQEEHFNRQIASSNNIGYKIVNKDDLVLSPMNLWLGSIDVSDFEIGIVSPAYKVYSVNYNYINRYYLKELVRSHYMIQKYNAISQKGASVVRRNLNITDFENIQILIPNNIDEMNEIGNIFKIASDEISLLEQELEQLKKQKKGLMQLLLTGIVRVGA